MAGSNVKHAKVSTNPDGSDTDLIQPSDFNAAHKGAVEVMDRDDATNDVENTAVETSLYSHSIPGNAMGTDGGVRLAMGGDCAKLAAGTLRIRVKFGTTTVFDSGVFTPTNSAGRYKWEFDLMLRNTSATTQKITGKLVAADATDSFAVHIGGGTNAFTLVGSSTGVSSEDTTTAKTLDVTIEWSAASALLSFRKQMALLELIPEI